jgi:hypothetical protein
MAEKDGNQDELRVYSKTAWDEEWTMIEDAEYSSSITEWTKVSLLLPEPLSTTYYIGIEGYSKFGHGVCIDSIAVYGEPKAVYTLTLNIEGNGVVKVDGVEYAEPIEIYEGTELSLEAIADHGWSFDGWSGDFEETENPASFVLDSDMEITVTFTEKPKYSLEITIVGNGSIEVDGEEYTETMMIYEGSEIVLEAKPSSGWKFDEWTGDLTGTTNPKNLTVLANKSVTATFSQSTSTVADRVSEPNIFPNPFDGMLSVSNAREINLIVITNLIGQKVMEIQLVGQEVLQLNTDHLAKGIYLISLSKSDGDRVVRKIVKR